MVDYVNKLWYDIVMIVIERGVDIWEISLILLFLTMKIYV